MGNPEKIKAVVLRQFLGVDYLSPPVTTGYSGVVNGMPFLFACYAAFHYVPHKAVDCCDK